VDAKLQGLLITAAASFVLAGCAATTADTEQPGPEGPAAGGTPPPSRGPVNEPVTLKPQAPVTVPGLGPEILLPATDAQDDEVARVGELVLRKSDAFTRLMTADPKLALSAVDLLVFDALVARHAEQFGIVVDPVAVEELAVAEEQRMQRQVESELGKEMDFAAYVFGMFGMRLTDWQRTLRLRTAQRLYQGYVIRYLALLEDRVQVRYLVHRDREVVDEVTEKVRAGADFATLALRWSENGRRDGGLLPAFGRGFPHPVADVAFTLEKGEVSEPFEKDVGDEKRWFVVYCLDRVAGRDVPFAEVRDEIDQNLVTNPLSQVETSAYALLWRGAIEAGGVPAGNDR